ncbi:uncharacterized abhydrolase domain-containing protein DDB_G0269086-like isoform X3 [Zootermopsis nevadensis]|uniref:uncharacterized abhydrolase domain-containing protein DDB_G0269086-like isoform X3 n=1 Tax=Zootermopsis nevadensis TaxID=136037 RepID=UPI000B8EAA11|nr:uncharacterized abhydrolase domain-containing protein DDB_G0269086-like isoform X3 [Zootermopsis nevadensis]
MHVTSQAQNSVDGTCARYGATKAPSLETTAPVADIKRRQAPTTQLPDSRSFKMVYESDFYTTRRPYSRPTVTSYSVTAQTFHHSIPFVAHKRLTTVSPPAHTVRLRPSIILAEIDRINHKVRPSLAYQPAEDYLNSRSAVTFDDETRSIRAQTAALLKRIHEPLPRATKIFPISVARYQESPVPERITSDAYIRRLLGPTHNVRQEILSISHYDEPAKRLMGKGHLACVSFAGGRAFPRRKNLYDDDRVKNDVQYLSHYKKNREAAENPHPALVAALSGEWYRNPSAYTSPPRSRPISRFYRPTYVPDDNLSYHESPSPPIRKTPPSRSHSQPATETLLSTVRAERQISLKEDNSEDRINRRKKKRQEEAKLTEEKALEEQAELEKQQEEARQVELARQEKLAHEAALERQKELERKAELARQAEEEAERQAELERQEAERKAEAERQAELERQEAERKAEAERQAELERQEAERKAEAERQAELERQEAERKAEAERQAELERQEAERKAEAERQAELERQEAERKAEAERQAELERQEAERKAEEERQAEAEHQAELERQRLEEELAKLEGDAKETDVTSATEATSDVLSDETAAELTKESEAAPKSEEEPEKEDGEKEVEAVTSPGAEEDSGPEPVVEEPSSPEATQEPTAGSAAQEVHEEEEEDEEEDE